MYRDLYFGSNGANEVYSFLTSDGSSVTNFSGDINSFFTVSFVSLAHFLSRF